MFTLASLSRASITLTTFNLIIVVDYKMIKTKKTDRKKSGLFLKLFLLLASSVLIVFSVDADVMSDFSTDVIGINEHQLYPAYWVSKLKDKKMPPLMSRHSIEQFNHNLIHNNIHIFEPLSLSDHMSKNELVKAINSISSIPSSERFYLSGEQLSQQHYDNYIQNLNIQSIKAQNKVQFALVTKRTILRTFPTLDKVFKKNSHGKMNTDLDRFQESGLFPGDEVAILHSSKDGQWVLVQAYNYLAWMPNIDVAIGKKSEILKFKKNKTFIVITGSKVFTNHVPEHPELSKVQLDMGVRLPLASRSEYGHQLYGQNPFANYIVQLPIRNDQGKLKFSLALIPRSEDVSIGYLAFTKQHLVEQSFKFLGERYGWGHDYNGRDCTGFVGEIYRSFGFMMPRNSGQQGKSSYGKNIRFSKNSSKIEKLAILKNLQVGDLIYIPGHVMMYLGNENGEPYVIHDVNSLAYLNEKGAIYRGILNGVSVTPLFPLRVSKSSSYVDNIYNIKTMNVRVK